MSNIITCPCGAKVRLPRDMKHRSLRCPQCKTGIALSLDAEVLSSTQFVGGSATSCPICQSSVSTGDDVVDCPECDQVHHRDCWSEVGGCGTYGCVEAPVTESKDASAGPVRSAWGDTKRCPSCGTTIRSIALRCRHCGAEFDTVDPMTARAFDRTERTKEVATWLRIVTVVCFVLSIYVPCLAPLIAIVVLIFVIPKRRELAKAGLFYKVLGHSAGVISLLYSIMMLIGLVYDWLR